MERDGGSRNPGEGENVPICGAVGETARSRRRNTGRGSEQEEGERRTLLPVERESNVEKEEVGRRARDEENEW